MFNRKYIFAIQIITLIFLVLFSLFEENYKLIFTYFFFFLITLAIDLVNKNSNLNFFFNFYLIGSIILIVLNRLDHNTNWYSIDTEMFYNISIGESVVGVYLSNIKWVGYFFLLNEFYTIIAQFIDASVHFYHGILMNIFFSSFIPYFYQKHFKDKLSSKSLKKALIILLILPQFLMFTSTYLRDSFIMLFFAMLVYYINSKEIRDIKKITLVILTLGLTFTFRPASSFFLLIYVFIHFHNSIKKRYLLTLVIILLGFYYYYGYNFRDFESTAEGYKALTNKEASDNSLGNRLYNINNLFVFPLKILYLIFSPIPPPILSKLSLRSFFLSLGYLASYYYIILYFTSLVKNLVFRIKDEGLTKDFIYLLVISTIVILTSRDPRHLSYFYPLIFIRGIVFIEQNKKFSKDLIFLLIGLILPILIAGYITLK
jgi:hypothetical protein